MGPEALFGLLAVIFLLLFGLSLGRTRAIISLLGIYIAFVLQMIFPYFQELHKAVRFSPEMYVTRIAVFFIFYILTFSILNRSLIKSRLTMKEYSFFWVSFMSLLQLGILMSIVLNFIPIDKITKFPPSVLPYFADQRALFGWLIAPVIVLIFMRREKRTRSSASAA